MFYDRFIELCNEKKVSPSAVLTKIGMNRSTATFWKQGKSEPSQEAITKIANYFKVSLDYLMDREIKEKEKPVTISDDELNKINSIFSQLDPDNRAKLLELAFLYLDAQHKNKENQ